MPERAVIPGEYWVLSHRLLGCVMSNTPAEITDHAEFFREAKGHVLILGLGLGMAAEVVASKKEVDCVTVIEKDLSVISLVEDSLPKEKIVLLHDDAFEFTPTFYHDFVWHDIWPTISVDNLNEMKVLEKRYRKFAIKQGFWCKKECLAAKRRGF